MAHNKLIATSSKAWSTTGIAAHFIYPISPHPDRTKPVCEIITAMPFNGLRVLSLESRRAIEMATLIRKQGGDPIVAPSMREMPLESNQEAFAFAERLFAGEFEMIILLTGVGTRYLDRILSTRYEPGKFAQALRQLTVVVRGPKPAAV